MSSWRTWLSRFVAGEAAAKAPARPGAKPKSAERIRNEELILETRRQILAKLDRLQQDRAAKGRATEAVDRDTERAAFVVRQMLADLESKDKGNA
jgi:hypothetical protein